ncbi:unnamed protein product [Absidia cylindrospora]
MDEEEVDDDNEYNGDDTPLDSYFGPLGQGDSKDQEQGDELGEELLVEYDEDDDDDDEDAFKSDSDGLMFEDDEEPLDFKNDEQVDLDQLLFDASQKDTNINMGYDYQQQQQEDEEEIEDSTNDAIDELLSNADDALIVDPLDETTADAEHPDHNIQEQQQQQPPPNDDLLVPSSNNNNNNNNNMGTPYHHSSSQYKLPLFGVLALLILLYKVSNKKQGGRAKCLEKEEKGLPLHTKDLKTSDSGLDCSILVESSASPLGTTTTQPSTIGGHHHLGRRASSSSFFTPRQASTGGGGGAGGHTRKISLGHHPIVGSQAIKESKWEDKYRQ